MTPFARSTTLQWPPPPARAWRDLAAIALLTLLVALACVRYELSETFFAFTRRWEHLQLDELAVVFFALALGLAWFAVRRYREARAELALRRAAEARLARMLLENRQLAREYLRVQESERKSLARELHDELGQYLNAIKTDAVSIQDKSAVSPAGIHRAASAIVAHADHVHAVVRDLIRKLRPVGLDELGLQAALEHCFDYWRERLPDVRFAVSMRGALDELGEPLALALYRLTQEGLTNIARHAQARAVDIRIARTGPGPDGAETVVFEMLDDGRGAELSGQQTGVGLIGMRERVEMLGGKLHLTSAPTKGFSIAAQLPC
jgi:two-component system, NarL family, sensor histidine kinase UhpB